MDNSLFSVLCGIYGRSALPSAVTQGEKTYKNEGFEKLFSSFGEEDRRRFTEAAASSDGTGCGFFGGRFYSFNVIKEQDISITEVTGSDTVEKTLQIPAVREYLDYFFSRLRSSVTAVSAAADGIYGILSAGGKSPGQEVADKLNAIDGRLADIISSVIDPEQLLYLTGENTEDNTVSLKDELTAAAEDLKTLLYGQTKVDTCLEAGIYARLNRKAFRTIIADAVAECRRGDIQLKCINIALRRLEDGSAEAALTAEYASGTSCVTGTGSFGEDVFNRFMQVFNDEPMADFNKYMCDYWLEKNLNSISTEYIDTKNSSYHNVKVGNVTFDFACEKKQAVYAYYDITPGGKLTQKLWNEIENSTTKKRPFYENKYVICTVNRVPDSFWTLSKRYDNVHIVSQKMLFATYKKEYNRIAHPRFVPSFV